MYKKNNLMLKKIKIILFIRKKIQHTNYIILNELKNFSKIIMAKKYKNEISKIF